MKRLAAFAITLSLLFALSFLVPGCTSPTPIQQQIAAPLPQEQQPQAPSQGGKPLKGSAISDEEISKVIDEAMAEQQAETGVNAAPQGAQGDAAQTSGSYIAALNYKVTVDGFKFENYGNESPGRKNLGADEMQKMFGKDVCSNTQGSCILSPPAKQWAEQNNAGMGGGHCEGMATLSLLFNLGTRSASDFGGENAYALSIDGNEKLQREIAYWWATQAAEPTASSTLKAAPNDIVEKLTASFKSADAEKYTLGIYKRDMSGGHAITPFAIEDKGNSILWILVYDNNYPGVNRAVVVDTAANTWKYTASTNPAEAASEYDGDAQTKNLEITPTSARMKVQLCSFCAGGEAGGASAKGSTKGALAATYNELWVDGKADLLATDANGKRLGFANGSVVEEIPGAHYIARKASTPVYQIPSATGFNLTVDGSRLREISSTDVVMIGPGYDLGILNITLAPGKKSNAIFSPSGNSIAYTSSSPESPDIIYGIVTASDDYEFYIKGVELETGATITSTLDTANGKLGVSTRGNSRNATFFFEMNRIDDYNETTFGNDEGIVLEPNDTIYFNYANWTGSRGALTMEIYDGSGKLVETEQLKDTD